MTKLLLCALLLLSRQPRSDASTAACRTAGQASAREEMEPGVNTSAPSQDSRRAERRACAGVHACCSPRRGQPARGGEPGDCGKSTAKDRLDLDSSQITGNRELPTVLYVVPWRGAELGDLVGRPVNSLLDEVLEPVDRDVFRRQNRYFEALQPNQAIRPPVSLRSD